MNKEQIKKRTLSNWDLINRLASKRFHKRETAEEAALYVLEELARNDWEKLQTFSGKSRFTTFFSSVVYRLLEDYSRKRFGRITTPKWIRTLDGIWALLFKLLCLERFSFQDAVHMVISQQPEISANSIEQAAEDVIGRVTDCGKSDLDGASGSESLKDHPAPAQILEDEKNLMEVLGHYCFGDDYNDKTIDNRFFKHQPPLHDEEKLLLKLCFRDGLSKTEAGKMLGLNRFQAHGRIRRTLKKIRESYMQAGFDKELKLILSDT